MEFELDKWRELYLQYNSTNIQQHPLLSFDEQDRWGYYGRGLQVGVQIPENVLRRMTQTIFLTGYSDPCQSYGSIDLDLSLFRLLIKFKTDDPAPKLQLDLPIQTIQCVADFYRTKQTLLATMVAELLAITFFSLLIPGEYGMN